MPEFQTPTAARWSRFKAASVRGFHAYANWLVGIGWWRFALLSVLLLISAGVLQNIPPFSWRLTERIETLAPKKHVVVKKTSPHSPSGYDIKIDEHGIVITPRPVSSTTASTTASSPNCTKPDVVRIISYE